MALAMLLHPMLGQMRRDGKLSVGGADGMGMHFHLRKKHSWRTNVLLPALMAAAAAIR